MILHKQYLHFLFKTGLTQAEFLLLYLIHKKDQEYIDLYKERFPTGDGTMIGDYNTKRLLKQGWIIEKEKNLEVTEKFKKYLFDDSVSDLNYSELLDYYPKFFENKEGTKLPLVLADKFVYNSKYSQKVCYNAAEHNEVLKDLQYGIDNNLINFGIAKFIDSNYWEILRPMRLDDTDFTGGVPDDDTFK